MHEKLMGAVSSSMVFGPGSRLGETPPAPTLRNRLEQVQATMGRVRLHLSQIDEKVGKCGMSEGSGATPTEPPDPTLTFLCDRLGEMAAELEVLSSRINGTL